MGVVVGITTFVLVFVCLALIGLILMQRGRGGGLAGVFGGGGVEQAFGTRAATLAQKATAVLAVLFLMLTVVLGILHQQRHRTLSGSVLEEQQAEPSEASGQPVEQQEAQ